MRCGGIQERQGGRRPQGRGHKQERGHQHALVCPGRRTRPLTSSTLPSTDFERVLGKRKAEELQQRQQQQQEDAGADSDQLLEGLPHPSLRYYMQLAGRKVQGDAAR